MSEVPLYHYINLSGCTTLELPGEGGNGGRVWTEEVVCGMHPPRKHQTHAHQYQRDRTPRPLRALIPNTVELIPTLGALFPRGGPVQDPVLTPTRQRTFGSFSTAVAAITLPSCVLTCIHHVHRSVSTRQNAMPPLEKGIQTSMARGRSTLSSR